MYTNMRNIQILVALLKAYNIRNLVLAPGGSDIPIIHSVEEDSFFECYSVVDERSLIYFALGLAQEKKEIVACVCTSGTAVSNFLPGITEAFYQNVPLVAITADKSPYFLDQMETQKIDQIGIFDKVCKKSVNLPIIRNQDDEWLCGRLINEALLEVNHHGTGPVQINIPVMGDTTVYTENLLPSVKKINLVSYNDTGNSWKCYQTKLHNAEKIMVIVGQNIYFDSQLKDKMKKFFNKFNVIFSVEHMSNLDIEGTVHTYPLTEMHKNNINKELVPDIVISVGNNVSSYVIKTFLRENRSRVEHWSIDEMCRVRDTYMCLNTLFECSLDYFLDKMLTSLNDSYINKKTYYNMWKIHIDKLVYPNFEFSNFYVGKKLSEIIPANSVLHLAILNSTRIMQFFRLNEGIRTYSNIGALGIDGCLSSFVGQASATKDLAFCLIGDLSFFYDMNAASIRHLSNNARIILLNNGGAAEFHFFMGKEKIPTINKHISVANHRTAKGWVESLGYKYYAVSNKEEADTILPLLAQYSNCPIFLEVFTDMESDASISKEFYASNYPKDLKSSIKKVASKVLKEKQYQKLLKMYGKFVG